MKISLRPGEKIYVNGAVLSVDRRVSLTLMNDVTFLLESHVMQPKDATTPLRQVYFAIQTMLMDPGAAQTIGDAVSRMVRTMFACESDFQRRAGLLEILDLLKADRAFDALRQVRKAYMADDEFRKSTTAEEEALA